MQNEYITSGYGDSNEILNMNSLYIVNIPRTNIYTFGYTLCLFTRLGELPDNALNVDLLAPYIELVDYVLIHEKDSKDIVASMVNNISTDKRVRKHALAKWFVLNEDDVSSIKSQMDVYRNEYGANILLRNDAYVNRQPRPIWNLSSPNTLELMKLYSIYSNYKAVGKDWKAYSGVAYYHGKNKVRHSTKPVKTKPKKVNDRFSPDRYDYQKNYEYKQSREFDPLDIEFQTIPKPPIVDETMHKLFIKQEN